MLGFSVCYTWLMNVDEVSSSSELLRLKTNKLLQYKGVSDPSTSVSFMFNKHGQEVLGLTVKYYGLVFVFITFIYLCNCYILCVVSEQIWLLYLETSSVTLLKVEIVPFLKELMYILHETPSVVEVSPNRNKQKMGLVYSTFNFSHGLNSRM